METEAKVGMMLREPQNAQEGQQPPGAGRGKAGSPVEVPGGVRPC